MKKFTRARVRALIALPVLTAVVLAVCQSPAEGASSSGKGHVAARSAQVDPGVPGLVADEATGTFQSVTKFKDGSYKTTAPAGTASTCPPCETLSVGTPAWTGVYKKLLGPGSTYHYVKVYRRSFNACHGFLGGLVVSCMAGNIVYAAGFAACFNGCTVAGQRGMQYCGTGGSYTLPGATNDVVGCHNHLATTGPSAYYASVANETDKMCNQGFPIGACATQDWHVNAYGSGYVTGPYGGKGSA